MFHVARLHLLVTFLSRRTLSRFLVLCCFQQWNLPDLLIATWNAPFFLFWFKAARLITHCCILKEITKDAPTDLLRATVWCYHHHLKRIQTPPYSLQNIKAGHKCFLFILALKARQGNCSSQFASAYLSVHWGQRRSRLLFMINGMTS